MMDDDTFAMAATVPEADASMETQVEPGSMTTIPAVLPKVSLVDGQPTLHNPSSARFDMRGQLGKGGIGEVLRARDLDIGRDVAIKRLLSKASSQSAIARFIDEMRVTGSLDHPNVVPIHDVGVDANGEYYFVMRHVRGETLEDIIARLAADDPETHHKFGVERRIDIFMDILEAVSYAHSQGIIHRDLKPANIMVGPYGEVVVMDWGVAKPIKRDEDLATLGDAAPAAETEGLERAFETQAGALVGTPAYMAPEQVLGQAVDERSDIYALSVILRELLFLEHYLGECTNLVAVCDAVVNKTPGMGLSTKSKLQPNVPADLFWIVSRGMQKDPEKRYQSVADMLDIFERRAEGEIQVQCPFTATKSTMARIMTAFDRHPVVVIGVVGAFLASWFVAVGLLISNALSA